LESVAKAHSGTLLVLDELGELGFHEAGRVASYMLANGQSKIRATREATTRTRSE
jgi:putative DNA primase/helicase